MGLVLMGGFGTFWLIIPVVVNLPSGIVTSWPGCNSVSEE